MKIDSLKQVMINGSRQWILVRGNSDAPLLIHVQAGPGFAMIPEANAMQRQTRFENDFLVAYWDRRSCGKSFDKKADPAAINFSQLTDDVISCTEYLLDTYGKRKAIIVGYSIGATLALMATSKKSSIFDHLFLVGTDIDIPFANQYAIEFALSKAKEKNDQAALKKAIELSGLPINNSKEFLKRGKLMADLGGIKMNSSYLQMLITNLTNMLFCKAYRFGDILRTIKGMEFSQNAFLKEMNTLNLFESVQSIDCPVHFIHGKNDAVAPYATAAAYYEFLHAPKKTFSSFERSAHLPHYDEPERFAQVVRDKFNTVAAPEIPYSDFFVSKKGAISS